MRPREDDPAIQRTLVEWQEGSVMSYICKIWYMRGHWAGWPACRIGMSPCKPVRMATTINLKPNIPSHSAPSPSPSPRCRCRNSVQAHRCVVGDGRTMITGIRYTMKPLRHRDPGIATKQAAFATQIHHRHRAQFTYQHHHHRRSQPRNTATSTSPN
jgi:hypothetical protein